MKHHFWLGLSVLVAFSHRKYGSVYEDAREKILEVLWGVMQIKN